MLRGLYTAYTGMLNEQYRMDIMSNNLANADTTGFKKEGSTSQAYSEVMAVKIKDVTENPNTPKRLGKMSLGVKIGRPIPISPRARFVIRGIRTILPLAATVSLTLSLPASRARPLQNIQEQAASHSQRTVIW